MAEKPEYINPTNFDLSDHGSDSPRGVYLARIVAGDRQGWVRLTDEGFLVWEGTLPADEAAQVFIKAITLALDDMRKAPYSEMGRLTSQQCLNVELPSRMVIDPNSTAIGIQINVQKWPPPEGTELNTNEEKWPPSTDETSVL